MKNAICTQAARGERLGVVLECIWWRVRAGVGNRQSLSVFEQYELQFEAAAVNGAGFDISGYAKAPGMRARAHGAQLLNRDVVTLTVLHAGVSEIAQRKNDHQGRGTKLNVFARSRRHSRPPPSNFILPVWLGSRRWVKDADGNRMEFGQCTEFYMWNALPA